jgi:hypothetical protein
MTSPPDDVIADEHRLHEIIAVYLQADQEGQNPSRQELLDLHPDLAEELRAFFADHDKLKRWAEPPPLASRRAAALAAPSAGTQVRYIGDYELLGEIASGGMGVVYRARQRSLNRVVALKMIRGGILAGGAETRRFQSEAETAANMDHSNIIPIYEVGDYQGQPYFTMKYIEGGNLSQHVPRLVDDPRAAAKLMLTVARAVHHAHERGLLHRDLKPGNILVDAKGQPHITDFGLAKREAKLGEPSLTQTGAIVGTPSYMAPEQASGRSASLTKAADIYSLGAILYELLTARPPFKAATPLDTLRQVADQEPKPPRALNPRLPRDLETICLKCLSKEPQKRYVSAEELARDLECFLEGLPIQARRRGLLGRAFNWSRRRVRVAVIVILLLGLLMLFALRLSVVRVQRERALVAFLEAEAARAAQIERDFQLARQTVDELLTGTVDMELSGQPALIPTQRKLLQEAMDFYQLTLEEKGNDAPHQFEKAKAQLRVGEIQLRLGNLADAENSTRTGIALLRKKPLGGPIERDYQAQFVHAYGTLGIELLEQGKHQQASNATKDLLELQYGQYSDYRRAAGVMARCVALAEGDPRLPHEEGRHLAGTYAKQAVELLRKALQSGFKNVEDLKKARDLEAVRSRSDFRDLVRELETQSKSAPH